MGISLVLAVLFAFADLNSAQHCEENNEESWSYHGSTNGPDEWKEYYPSCEENQSPIRMFTDMMHNERNLTKLVFMRYDEPIVRGEIENDGRRVIIRPLDKVQRGIVVEGREYILEYVQFHFGSKEKPGAEHTINHVRYPMEIQFIHKNSDNQYAAVALLIDVSDHEQIVKHDAISFGHVMTSVYTKIETNPAFDPILEVLPAVAFKDEISKLYSPLTLNFLLPESPASFYRYSGTLTTPPCDRAIWSVLKRTTCIGRHQLGLFLGVFSIRRDDEPSPECLMTGNYRPAEGPRDVSASQ